MDKKNKGHIFAPNSRNQLVFALFILFLLLRTFIETPYRLTADNLKFLELANNFPDHTLYDGAVYLQHPPLYPYLIHFFDFITGDDYFASVLLSLVSACIAFVFVYKLIFLISGDFKVTLIALILFTFSVELINSSYRPARESFMVMLIILSLYFFIKGISTYEWRSALLCSFFGAMTAMTTDHVIFLFPAFIFSYIFFNKKMNDLKKLGFYGLKFAAVPIIVTFISYCFWIGLKAYIYSSNQYYPAGLEGTPIEVGGFGLPELLNPTYFEDYESGAGVGTGIASRLKNIVFNFGYMINMEPFSIPRGLNFKTAAFLLKPLHLFYFLALYLPLTIITLLGAFKVLKSVSQKNGYFTDGGIFALLMVLVFLFPITQKVASPRYLYPAYIFVYYLSAIGILSLLTSVKQRLSQQRIRKFFQIFGIALGIAAILVWVPSHSLSILKNEKFVIAGNTSQFAASNFNKNDLIMAQPGYVVALTYSTGNRVLGLPPTIEQFSKLEKIYKPKYIVFGRIYTYDNYQYSIETINYVIGNPKKFKKIAVINEDYTNYFKEGDKARTDEIYIYELI